LTLAAPERRSDFLEMLAMRELRTESRNRKGKRVRMAARDQRGETEDELRNPVD